MSEARDRNHDAGLNPSDRDMKLMRALKLIDDPPRDPRVPVAKPWRDVAIAERNRLSRLQEVIERHRKCPSCTAPACMAEVVAANDNIWLETHPGEA